MKVGAFMIDLKLFGRKNSMVIFYFLSMVANILTYNNPQHYLVLATISKIFIGINIIFCFQYTSESNGLLKNPKQFIYSNYKLTGFLK